jgi:O-antigen/teichoic acid export membrane protein
MGWGLEGVAAATLLTSIASVVCNYVLFKICCSGASISSSFLDRGATIELMLFGLPAAVTIIAEILRTKLDTVVVAGFVDMGSVTIYAIAISLVAFFTSAMVTTSAVLDPRFSQLKGLEKNEEISRLYLRSVLLFTSMAFSIGLTLVWIGKGFIALWVGPGYENSYTILVILITGQMFAAIQMPTISVLFSLNRHRICAVLALLEGFCNLVLSILLVRKWGIIGVAVGTLIPMLVFKILLLPLCAIRELGLSARHYYVAISKPVILLITVSLLIRYVYVPADLSWPGVVVLTCGSVAVLAALANWLAVSQEYRFSANSVKNVLFSLFGLPERGRS